MTVRAVILGLGGAGFICGFTYFNDAVLRQSLFVGNHMPIAVYGPLLLFLMVVNPALQALTRRFEGAPRWLRPFSGRELAVAIALSLASCCVPYSSMLRLLSNIVMLPHHHARNEVGWKWQAPDGERGGVLDYLPERMTPDLSSESDRALDGFVQGLRVGEERIAFSSVPWGAWLRPFGFWLPLLMVLSIALTGLAVALHGQWSSHEHLPYPVVKFTKALLPEEGRSGSPIFGNPLFWIGACAVMAFHANNYMFEWHPQHLIRIPRTFDFRALARLFPTLMRGGGWPLLFPRLYFSFIAIAFLLATDVSLSVGLGPFIFRYVGGVLAAYGIAMGSGTRFAPRIDRALVFGGYVGMFASICYTGRHHYANLLRRAFGWRAGDETGAAGVWGVRVFAAGMFVFIVDLCLLGLDWRLATLYSALTVVIFVVMARIIAETGLFFIAPYLYPCVLIYGILGERSVGLHALMILFMLTCAILIDPRETLLPYLVNGLKLADDCKVEIGRTAGCCVLAILLGLAIAAPITLYLQYDHGVNWNDYWATQMVPKFAPEEVGRIRQLLSAQGALEHSETVSGWRRFFSPTPEPRSTIAFAIGLLGVLIFAAGRLRFPKWPLHPVLFLVWGGWAGYMVAWPFLIGGFIKMAVVKYGGTKAYQRVKPLMFGLIAGDMLSGIAITFFGLAYYMITGRLPKPYLVLLG